MQRLGWHVVVYFEAPDLVDLTPFLKELPGIVVVDHMGRPDVTRPVDGEDFGRFVRLMEELPTLWTKVSCPERLTAAGPPYDDVVPFQRHLVERFPDRVLWGTDWPHPNMKSHSPDDGLLVDTIARIAPTEELQRARCWSTIRCGSTGPTPELWLRARQAGDQEPRQTAP